MKKNILKVFRLFAAGADIGSAKIFISVEGQPVVNFGTFTSELKLAIDYLLKHQVKTIAMEATGVYWINFYTMLEEAGIEAYLVNGRETRNLPGRKTDVKDCEWIRELHTYGMLKQAFVPPIEIRKLRHIIRQREEIIETSTISINRMQKALVEMNIQFSRVISSITGVSGMRVVEAILHGEKNPESLAALCDDSILRTKRKEVIESLNGHYSSELIFALKQSYAAYQFAMGQIYDCDLEIDKQLAKMMNGASNTYGSKKSPKKASIKTPKIEEIHGKLLTISNGRDVTKIPGITDYTSIRLLGELGDNLDKFPSEKHFTSWAGLAPGKNESGFMKKRSKKRAKTRVGQIFRIAAQSILKSKTTVLSDFARKLRSRKGPAVAIVATARKIAEMFYRTIKFGMEYVEVGIKEYQKKQAEKLKKFIQRKAGELNMQVGDFVHLANVVH